METLELVEPAMAHKDQVMAFKAEMLEYGSDFDGCAGLGKVDTYEEWLDFRGRKAGEEKVLVTCDHQGNPGSEKTILANGGVLENEVEDAPGLGKSGIIRRYWITI